MSKKKTKIQFSKGLIIVIVLAALTAVAGVTSVVLLSQNRTLTQIFGSDNNVYDSARLEKLSFNGYQIGQKLPFDKPSNYLVFDADFNYQYNDINFWADDGVIVGLGFNTTYDIDGKPTKSIDDVKITYEEDKLTKLEDFEETFGIGKITESDNHTTLEYHQDGYSLTVIMRKDTVVNVTLKSEK